MLSLRSIALLLMKRVFIQEAIVYTYVIDDVSAYEIN